MPANRLENLTAWRKARSLRNSIFELTKEFPGEENYRLRDQIIRSARSVSANIAEGFGRYHFKENIQFSRMSRGSLFETMDHLYVALDRKYIDQKTFRDVYDEINTCLKILNGYINFLVKTSKKESTVKDKDPGFD